MKIHLKPQYLLFKINLNTINISEPLKQQFAVKNFELIFFVMKEIAKLISKN